MTEPIRLPQPIKPPKPQKTTAGVKHVSQVVKEPTDNVHGPWKFLRRTDGLFVVFDTRKWPYNGEVYQCTEEEARAVTKHKAGL